MFVEICTKLTSTKRVVWKGQFYFNKVEKTGHLLAQIKFGILLTFKSAIHINSVQVLNLRKKKSFHPTMILCICIWRIVIKRFIFWNKECGFYIRRVFLSLNRWNLGQGGYLAVHSTLKVEHCKTSKTFHR